MKHEREKKTNVIFEYSFDKSQRKKKKVISFSWNMFL